MKKTISIFIIFCSILTSQDYEIDNMRAIGRIPFGFCNDIWGYTAPDGHEFALVGLSNGTSIVDISTNPHDPVEVGFIPGVSSTWRDLKVHGHYCYVTNESGGGLDIINLEDPFNPYKVGSYTATFTTAHNIFIADGYAYVFGANSGLINTRGCRILDVSTDPENPVEVGSWEDAYFHDGYVKNDTLYGCDIYNGSLYIVDVSDKSNPITMVEHNYSNYGCHAVWVSGDSKYAITADEKGGGFINIFDIQDFSNINLLSTWYPDEPQAPYRSVHNVFWKDDLLYISYYVYGTRIVDMSDPSNPVEVGYYDFFPGDGSAAAPFQGNWGTYPYTENGLIYSTGFSGNGFFVMSYPFYGEIEFEELHDTEDNVSPIPLRVTVEESPNYTIDYTTLKLFWGLNGTLTDSVLMNVDGEQYAGSIDPNGEDGDLHYYVSFRTTNGSVVTKPYDAPFSTFSFHIGPDAQLPVIHSVSDIDDQLYPDGSHTVYVEATDNIAVDSVYLLWQVGNGNVQSVPCTQVGTGSIYQGELTYNNVSSGTDISYWVQVIDATSMANMAESEPLLFSITDNYLLGDFEDEIKLDRWELGNWGRQFVNTNIGYALNDNPGQTYEPNAENPCDLIDPINLTFFDHAYLQFISGEMILGGDYGYLQVTQGTTGTWQTLLTVNGFNTISEKFVNLDDYLDEDELYLRLLFTSDGSDESIGWFVDDIHLVLNQEMPAVSVEDNLSIPEQIVLYPAYPNPFNPITTIRYSLPKDGLVNLRVYNLMGREIRSIISEYETAGIKTVVWDGRDQSGRQVSSGVYVYRLETQGYVQSRKLILLK